MKKSVLFVCIHNSARSQMAEEYLRKTAGDGFEAESAGIEPGTLNPLVVEVLREDGIDLTGKKTRSVFELLKAGRKYDFVITVCSKEAQERCPVFPGAVVRINWPFPDPSAFEGIREEKLARVREVYAQIKEKIEGFVSVSRDQSG